MNTLPIAYPDSAKIHIMQNRYSTKTTLTVLGLAGGLNIPAHADAVALRVLTQGVTQIAAPGLPGALAAFGDKAFPVVVGKASKAAVEPVVAATYAGAGRVVAFGHDGYFNPATLNQLDTGHFMLSAIRWAAARGDDHVLVCDEPQLVDWLGKHGVGAVAGSTAALQGANVCILSGHKMREADIAPLRAFLEGGGGLIVAETGWGWSWNEGGAKADLANDSPANKLLAPYGMVWTSATLDKTAPNGYAVSDSPPPLAQATFAYATLKAALQGQAADMAPLPQAAAVVMGAVTALPRNDKLLLPQLQALGGGPAVVPYARVPIKRDDFAARLRLSLQLAALNNRPPGMAGAHPAGAIFPGDVPETAKPTTKQVPIDLTIRDWHSLGLYAAPGVPVTVKLAAGNEKKGLAVRIGCHTDALWDQDEWKRVPQITRQIPLSNPQTKLANPFGGLVYIVVPSGGQGTANVEISGAYAAPLYEMGVTNLDEWRHMIRYAPGPWAEIAGPRFITTIPSSAVRALDDPESVAKYYDDGMKAVNDLAGMPNGHGRPERMVADEQISAGYMHSGYPIMTWLDVQNFDVEIKQLLAGDWGHWHEVGHNYQQSAWTFEGTGEVTNNMFPFYVNEKVAGIPHGTAHPNTQPAWQKRALSQYLAAGAPYAKLGSDPFLFLLFFEQLKDGFGWDTYKQFIHDYNAVPEAARPVTDEAKRDGWLVRYSKLTGRNLGPFFQAWGIPTGAAARQSVAALPTWMPANWSDFTAGGVAKAAP